MNDKEMLEEICKCVKHDLIHNHGMMLSISYQEVKWLIKQAERVQSLEFENHSVMQELNHVDAENKRYREAIKRAISKFNYDEHQQGMSELLGALEQSEETFTDGVWVTCKSSGKMTRITRIEDNRVYGNWHGSVVETWVDISNIRKSTKEEIEEEVRILNDPNTFDYFSN